MDSENTYKEIEEIKGKIVDYILIIGSILGPIAYIVTLIGIKDTGFSYNIITDFFAIGIIVLATFLRKKIDIKYRSLAIVIGLSILVFVDVYVAGMYAVDKILLVVIPLFSLLVYSIRQVVIIFLINLFVFLFFGYLYIQGSIVSDINYLNYSLLVTPWIINALLITIVSLVIMVVFYQFNRAFIKLVDSLKLKNNEISQREQNYREIFDSSTDAIFIHDMDGSILDVNSAMLSMYGYENIESINVGDLSSGEGEYTSEKSWEHLQKAIKNEKNIFDWHAKNKSGATFWVEVALKKVFILGDERILAVVRDIDEKKNVAIQLNEYKTKLEFLVKERTEELESANEELKSTNEELYGQRSELESALVELQAAQKQLVASEKMSSLGVLAAGVAHEINNPLNFIQGGVAGLESILLNESVENEEDVATLLHAIDVGVVRAAKIVSSLNHFSRQGEITNDECNINSIIDNCLVMLHNKTKNRINITKDLSDNNIIINGNEGRLHQAILNILSNAVQSIEDKGEVEVHTEIDKGRVIILIKDTGIGISEEDMVKIADPFFTTKAPGEGTGLGLSITYSIIKEHKGTIEYKSEVNEGTIVIITLPLSIVH